jgi:hypothetical protein
MASLVISAVGAFGGGALVGAYANHKLRERTEHKQEKQERKSLLFLMLLEILSNETTAHRWAATLEKAKKEGGSPNAKPPDLRIVVWEDARIRLAYLVPPEDFYVLIRYYHSVLRWRTKSEEEALVYFRKALTPRTSFAIKLIVKYVQEEMVRELIQKYEEEEKEFLPQEFAEFLERSGQRSAPAEPRKSPQTADEQQGRGETHPDAPEEQESAQRPWWRRVFGS